MPKPRLRKCCIPNCQKDIHHWLHFCKPHYALVPRALRDAMHNEWAYMKRAGVRHTQRHGELVCEAIEAVVDKLEKASAKRRAQGGDLLAA